MNKVIGIDLGTSNSVMAFTSVDTEILQNAENGDLTKSCVAYLDNEILVGKYAYNQLKKNPSATVLSVKRLMGGAIGDDMVKDMKENPYYQYEIDQYKRGTSESVAITIDGNQYTPQQVSSQILKKIKKDSEARLNDKVTHAVITVPAYFTEKQKTATKQAAEMAGLKVTKLLAEPTAAAIAYGVNELNDQDGKTVLIYDFGGGTFDLSVLSIVDNNFLEEGTGGDRWLGGDNIDVALTKFVLSKVQNEYDIENIENAINNLSVKKKYKFKGLLRDEVEKAKIQLSSSESANIMIDSILEDEEGDDIDVDIKITRKELENIVRPIGQKTILLIEDLLKKISYTEDMMDEILMVGGTSSIPLLQNMLKERFSRNIVKVGKKPMLTIAEGASMLAKSLGYGPEDIENDTEESNDIEVFTTTNHNYFIELQDNQGQVTYDKIIESGTPTPIKERREYKTVYENQQMMHLKIFADVENGEMELQTQGYVTLDNSNLRSGTEVDFVFELSGDETFSVTAQTKDIDNFIKFITLSRGEEDAKAYNMINEALQNVNSNKYSPLQRESFMKEVHKLIAKINNKGEISANDPFWNEAISDVNKAERELEDNNDIPPNDINVIITNILLSKYSDYIQDVHIANAQNNIRIIESNISPISIQNAHSELIEMHTQYGLFIEHFLIKIGADNLRSSDPREARKLDFIFEESSDAFKVNDYDHARRMINDGHEILNNNGVSTQIQGGTTIGK